MLGAIRCGRVNTSLDPSEFGRVTLGLMRETQHSSKIFFLGGSIIAEPKIYWQRIGASEKNKMINFCFWFFYIYNFQVLKN